MSVKVFKIIDLEKFLENFHNNHKEQINGFEKGCYMAGKVLERESLIIEAKETEKRIKWLNETIEQFNKKLQELISEKEDLSDKLYLLNKNIKDIEKFCQEKRLAD